MIATPPRHEQTRARDPDASGFVERDGVRIAWQCYGGGDAAVLLLPTWEIADSRIWKCQVPYLARTHTVVTFDPRGNGGSDRPAAVSALDRAHLVADALAVLDAAGVQRATVVSWCAPGEDLLLAIEHPDRVGRLVLIAPDLLVTTGEDEGLYDRIDELRAFATTFYARIFTEPHSTKQREDGLSWAGGTDLETITRGLKASWGNGPQRAEQLLRQVRCPTLVVHGTGDRLAGPARGPAVAERINDCRLLLLDGGGHAPHLRDPVRVNLGLREFIGSPQPREGRWTRARSRPRRALYLSSPIGLGHARRDIAIADELRKLRPDLEIEWLAQHPVTVLLEARGEHIHPASRELANESRHIASEAFGHDLHCFEAIRRMDEILLANFMVFHDVVTSREYDLWIGDEAWELDYHLHENPELKTAAYCWLTDFVGWLPMPDGGEHEAHLTSDYNAEMIEQIARYPRLRDRALFIGEPDDIVPDTFGPGLPAIREWTQAHYEFPGYITGFTPLTRHDRERARAELGYAPDELVCIVAVGGSGVGSALLRKVIDALPLARALRPELRMVAVTGPRIDPAQLRMADGLEIHAYVPDLHRHLGACDIAVVQGGLATTMELCAQKRPFLYFPLGHHFEQQHHVHHRLRRYGAGRRMDYEHSTPETIAGAIDDQLDRPVAYRDVDSDGAVNAAASISQLI